MKRASPAPLDIATTPATLGFREPADIRVAAGNDPLLLTLIETAAFRRLREIRFLGGIDYRRVPRPNGKPRSTRYTRYQHSLGVMRLARLYCARQNLMPRDRLLVCVAALLHDIGHPPLSHSMEPVFKDEFGIEHHGATKDIICGRVSLGKDVFSALRNHGIDVEELIAVISGEISKFDGFFDGPINFDTIEGILRSYAYIRDASTTLSPDIVTEAAIRRTGRNDRDIVDQFWTHKNWVYKNIINSKDGLLSDFACRFFLRRNLERVGPACYFGTEAEIFRKLPGLRELLVCNTFESEITRMIDEPVYFRERSYFIDHGGDFFARHDEVRYRHSRTDAILELKDTAGQVPVDTVNETQGAFFDDNPL